MMSINGGYDGTSTIDAVWKFNIESKAWTRYPSKIRCQKPTSRQKYIWPLPDSHPDGLGAHRRC
jgi:hypothetical protein